MYCTNPLFYMKGPILDTDKEMFVWWAQPSLACSASLSLLFSLNSLFAFLSKFLSLNWGESGIDQPAFHHSRARGKDKEWKCWRKSLLSLTSQESQCPGSFFSFFPKKSCWASQPKLPANPLYCHWSQSWVPPADSGKLNIASILFLFVVAYLKNQDLMCHWEITQENKYPAILNFYAPGSLNSQNWGLKETLFRKSTWKHGI